MPNFQAAGTGHETSVAWPTHVTDDLGILRIETATEAPPTPSGWLPFPIAAVQQSGTRLTMFYRFATSNAESNVTIPGVAVNHAWGQITTYRNVNKTNPFGSIVSYYSAAAATAHYWPQFKTHRDDELVVFAFAYGTDSVGPMSSAEACSALANLTERYDAGTVTANGGGLIGITGEMATPGIVTELTHTLVSTGLALIAFSLRPAAIHSISGTVTIGGDPAPNASNVITVLDVTQAGEAIVGSIAGGAGAYSVNVPYDDHDYVVVYDDGTDRGASDSAVAGSGFDIDIGGGGGSARPIGSGVVRSLR